MEEAVHSFGAIIANGEAALAQRLDEALLLIAAAAQPTLDVTAELRRLDELAAQAPTTGVYDLADWLFASGKFVGNTLDYYDPQNSYLNRVLDLQKGIPISLSVLLIEVGRRHGHDIAPVGMPGHFLTQVGPDAYVDAFHQGARLNREGCERVFQRLAGAGVPLPPGSLAHTPRIEVVQRVLANLRGIARQRSDANLAEVVLQLHVAFPRPRAADLLELANLLAAKGSWHQAANLAERAAEQLPAKRAEGVMTEAIRWRARLN